MSKGSYYKCLGQQFNLCYRVFTVYCPVFLILFCGIVHASDWQKVETGLYIKYKQSWRVPSSAYYNKERVFQYSALRAHLGYFELSIVDLNVFGGINQSKIDNNEDNIVSSEVVRSLSFFLKTVNNDAIVASVPASFPVSSRSNEPIGLLKIDGKVISNVFDRGPSALLCLDNRNSLGLERVEYQIPAFYRVAVAEQVGKISQCSDGVQVGPRIIEDPSSTLATKEGWSVIKYSQITESGRSVSKNVILGIPDRFSAATPYVRSVILFDDPGRDTLGSVYKKEVARNVYFILTHDPVTFWDMQDLIINQKFYGSNQFAPHWALNLVGGDYASLGMRSKGLNSIVSAIQTVDTQIGALEDESIRDNILLLGGAQRATPNIIVLKRRNN